MSTKEAVEAGSPQKDEEARDTEQGARKLADQSMLFLVWILKNHSHYDIKSEFK